MLKEVKTKISHYFVDEHGRRQGEYKEWFWRIERRLREHSFYVNGSWHGEYKLWYADGKICRHCFYRHGWEVSLDEIPLPKTEADRTYIMLAHGLQTFAIEKNIC